MYTRDLQLPVLVLLTIIAVVETALHKQSKIPEDSVAEYQLTSREVDETEYAEDIVEVPDVQVPTITSANEYHSEKDHQQQPPFFNNYDDDDEDSTRKPALGPSYNLETLPKCPRGFLALKNGTHFLCYLVTQPASFPPRCPFPTVLDYSEMNFPITNESVWVASSNNECMVRTVMKTARVNCEDKYPSICIYTYQSIQTNYSSAPTFERYCQRRYNSSCVSDDFSETPLCFCRSNILWEGQQRDSLCEELAVVQDPSENHLLMRLVQDEPCWIRPNVSTLYSFWSNGSKFNIRNFIGLSKDGWVPKLNGELGCAICKVIPQNIRPELRLSMQGENVELNITNALDVLDTVTCVASNATYSVEIILDLSNNSANFVRQLLELPRGRSGALRCKARQIPTLDYVYGEISASAEVCPSSETVSGNQTLHWPETSVGITTIPAELCLDEDGFPITRTCGEAGWPAVKGDCGNFSYEDRTVALNELLHSEKEAGQLSEDLLDATSSPNFTNFQLYLVSKIMADKLDKPIDSVEVAENLVKIVNNVMHIQQDTLKASQDSFNSTDVILDTLDKVLKYNDTDDQVTTTTEKLLVQLTDLQNTNFAGVTVSNSTNGFESATVNSLSNGTTLASLHANFDVGILIPSKLRYDLLECLGSDTSPDFITTMFHDDVLFNEATDNRIDGRVVGITIPDFNCSFTEPLMVVFNPSNKSVSMKCASWAYGFNGTQRIHGHWVVEKDPVVTNKSYQICEFNHITHFALMVLNGRDVLPEGHKKALDIVTAVGSALSLIGLVAVFMTAVIFRNFRSNNAIVIHFSIAMTAQILMLFVADNVNKNETLCIVFGALLHYIILVQFSWMLTIAFLQYKRYVVVFGSSPSHLVAIACLCCWGVPLIFIAIPMGISRDNYGENAYGLCYVLNTYFIYCLLIPISLIVLVNLMFFLRIMLALARSRRLKVRKTQRDESLLELRLAVLLYFLLGLSWGFGILASIGAGLVYSYLFCITATLQGFVLFLYFIVLNEKTRKLWLNLCSCCMKKTQYEVNPDSTSNPMLVRQRSTVTSNSSSDMLQKYKNRASSDF